MVKEPEFLRKHFTELGLEAILDRPEQFSQFLREDRARAAKLVRQSGIPMLD